MDIKMQLLTERNFWRENIGISLSMNSQMILSLEVRMPGKNLAVEKDGTLGIPKVLLRH